MLTQNRPEQFVAEFDTNVFGSIKVTRAILPHFRQRRAGTVVFIGSLSGWIGDPFCSAYSGSKFALEGMDDSFLSLSLSRDLEPALYYHYCRLSVQGSEIYNTVHLVLFEEIGVKSYMY